MILVELFNVVLKSVGIGFSITQMKFHPNNDNFLAVFGNKDCIIIVLDKSTSSAGIKVTQTIKLDLMLEQLGGDLSIVDCCWLPQCSTHLAVLTRMFLKVYDLSKDILSPAFCINEIQDASGLNYMTSMTIANVSGSTASQRIFVGTQSGTIYTHLLDNQELLPEHDALYFVEEVKINSEIAEINNSTTRAVVSLFYSNSTDSLYISYECGVILYGRPQLESNGITEINNPIQIDYKKAATGATLGYAVHFQDLGISDHTACVGYVSIKDDNWIPVICEISKKSIQFHVYKGQTRVVGLACVRNCSNPLYQARRIYVATDKGAVSIYSPPGSSQGGERAKENEATDSIQKYFTLDKLPKSVEMNADLFEDAIELTNSLYETQFSYSGDFATALNGAKSTIVYDRSAPQALIKGDNKKCIKMEAKFDNLTAEKPNNNLALMGIRVCVYCTEKYGAPDADDKLSIKLFNRTIKLKGNRKYYEIGFCDAEILYLHSVLKNKLTVEFLTKDPATYPISIYGVDVFSKRKESLKFNEKLAKLRSICEKEQAKDSEKGITDVVKEMMQSDDLPLLVNWREKFASMEDLLSSVRNKTVRDEKRLLFNLAEASTYVTEYMTDQQIENDLMYYIHPLIGEYICKVEEGQSKDSTNSKVILDSLMRLLKKCLEKLHKTDKVDASLLRYSQYNCFINYLKNILELHKNSVNENSNHGTELRASQV